MITALEEKILADLDAGVDELVIRKWISEEGLDDELTEFLYDFLDNSRAVKAYRETKVSDANLIIYLGIFFMVIALPFFTYHRAFGGLIFGLGVIIYRRGKNRKKSALSIHTIEELLPEKRSKFDR